LFGPEAVASYLLVSKESGKAAIVEVSVSKSFPQIQEGIRKAGVNPTDVLFVIVSHVHLDHAGCSGTLMAYLPNAKFFCHQRGARHMADPSALIAGATAVYGAEYLDKQYGAVLPVPADRIHPVTDKQETLMLGKGCSLLLEQTLGHAPHHIFVSLWIAANPSSCDEQPICQGVFTGDQFAAEYPFQRNHTTKPQVSLVYSFIPTFSVILFFHLESCPSVHSSTV
jgi:glyoxylase-like metal-dependent hydrolase (beta-lactamase superfamily II)